MVENYQYLKMKTPVDMLVAHFFSTSGQLKGKFVQEINPPWGIWWEISSAKGWVDKIGGLIKRNTDAPENVWEMGKPNGELKSISWLDLFRKSVIRKNVSKGLSKEVIVLTPDRNLFFDIVRKHFVLSQGEISFSVFESSTPYYLLKINNPSLWVFNMISEEKQWRWFNQVESHSGLFVEAGYYIHDITGDNVYNKFQLQNKGILLVQRDGRLVTIKPSWKQGEQLIKVDCPDIGIPEKDETEKIILPPKLRNTDEKKLHKLWKITDAERFKAILSNESLERFIGYSAWYTNDGNIWLIALKEYADRGLASIFSDAFESFVEIDNKVFTPSGTTISPKLPQQRLAEIFNFEKTSWVCFERKNEGVAITILSHDILKPIEDFITIQAEIAVNKAEEIKSSWTFNFPELKKKS